MAKRIISPELMQFIAIFQAVTKADVRDCFLSSNSAKITFVVQENNLGKALGKGASKIKILEKKFGKRVKVVEFKSEVKSFIKSLLFPLKIADISDENGIVEIIPLDIKSRGLLIGRNAMNLRNLEKITQRYFDITEIKVVNPQ